MSDWPDWLETIWQREANSLGDLSAVTAEALHGLADLERIAAETAVTNCSWTAATKLFGGAR